MSTNHHRDIACLGWQTQSVQVASNSNVDSVPAMVSQLPPLVLRHVGLGHSQLPALSTRLDLAESGHLSSATGRHEQSAQLAAKNLLDFPMDATHRPLSRLQ